ncbi:MAG: hypothetical protein JSV99_05695 [Planctomycetota bacterium]|nr:MAG: hypothetical protein JSV99_05695 [Planctomycetota bacterium]
MEGKRASEILLREAGDFAEAVGEDLKVLSREGLVEKLFEKVLKALAEERKGRSKEGAGAGALGGNFASLGDFFVGKCEKRPPNG